MGRHTEQSSNHAGPNSPLTTEAVRSEWRLTDAQRELLEDKFVLWDKASRAYGSGPDADMSRDYNRRAAEALKVALAICSEAF